MSHSGLPDAWSSPCLQPAPRRRYREFTQGVVDNGLNRLPNECLDQERLRFLFGETARAQIKQQALVERASGRTVATRYVIGEYFQFRLVVGLRLVGQQ